MDAEARTGTRILAAVGPQGATYAEIADKSGLPKGERLEAALRALVASGVLVRTEGRYRVPVAVPDDTPDPVAQAAKREANREQCREAAKILWARRRAKTDAERAKRDAYLAECEAKRVALHTRVLALWDAGHSRFEIAELIGQTPGSTRKLIARAKAWRAGQ